MNFPGSNFAPNVAEFYYFNLEHVGHANWSVTYDREQHGVQRGIVWNVCSAHGSDPTPDPPFQKTSYRRGPPGDRRCAVLSTCRHVDRHKPARGRRT